MIIGMGMRTFGQIGVFLAITRLLGIDAYGAYTAVLALASVIGNFTGLGAATFMSREVARQNYIFSNAWKNSIAAFILTVPILFCIYLLLFYFFFPEKIKWVVIISLGVSELALIPLSSMAMLAFQGHDRIGKAASLILVPIIPRFIAALSLIFIVYSFPFLDRLQTWAILYLISSFIAACYALYCVKCEFGVSLTPVWSQLFYVLKQSYAFSFNDAALKFLSDIDKTMLASITTLEIAGAYSAAYRIADIGILPLNALLASAQPRFARIGIQGVNPTIKYALKILPLPFGYTIIIGGILYFMAGKLPLLIGQQFTQAVDTLRWLAWLPLLSLPRLFMQSILVNANQQRILSIALCFGACLNIILNFFMIFRWGWRGAVSATYCAELIMLLILSYFLKCRR